MQQQRLSKVDRGGVHVHLTPLLLRSRIKRKQMHLQDMYYALKKRFEHRRVASLVRNDRCSISAVVELNVSISKRLCMMCCGEMGRLKGRHPDMQPSGLLIHIAVALRGSQSFLCLASDHVHGLAKHLLATARALEGILHRAGWSWS
jgi:hypothetical protein